MDNIAFTNEQVSLFSEILEQDILNIKILFYIAQCEQNKTKVHIKTLSENIKIPRPVGQKNGKGNIKSYIVEEVYIDRKRAERVVDRLVYASLITFEIQKPHKYIRLTDRGAQIAIYIQKKMQAKN
ncbi:hypothetical protein [Metasolibacillus sp.]|uniref:hypothetical protein n=1 Tax=Metasolibacillus sp. TaxID=2703680 RepID=UPI0025CBD742|nr:hypothetical protein [Metasolibacillus sp.]MCT6922838.1 hypothetical protein [Metasolibacillus sp.]MCT6938823.1 hypothetical protein [Metasolibacillus sp.]